MSWRIKRVILINSKTFFRNPFETVPSYPNINSLQSLTNTIAFLCVPDQIHFHTVGSTCRFRFNYTTSLTEIRYIVRRTSYNFLLINRYSAGRLTICQTALIKRPGWQSWMIHFVSPIHSLPPGPFLVLSGLGEHFGLTRATNKMTFHYLVQVRGHRDGRQRTDNVNR